MYVINRKGFSEIQISSSLFAMPTAIKSAQRLVDIRVSLSEKFGESLNSCNNKGLTSLETFKCYKNENGLQL